MFIGWVNYTPAVTSSNNEQRTRLFQFAGTARVEAYQNFFNGLAERPKYKSRSRKNRHLARAVQEQKFAEFYRIIRYKCEWHGIKFMTVDRFYPSSKLCSVYGHKKQDLKLSDRTYICEKCGTVIDRDMNASINLYQHGKSIINH